MPGYNPNCGNCHRCSKCRGNGTVEQSSVEKGSDGRMHSAKRTVTCPSCRGVGGSIGVGLHNHS